MQIKVAYYQFQLDRLGLRTEDIHEAHREASRRFYAAEDMVNHGRFAGTDKAFCLRANARISFADCAKREKDHLARICKLRRRISSLTSSQVGLVDAALLQ